MGHSFNVSREAPGFAVSKATSKTALTQADARPIGPLAKDCLTISSVEHVMAAYVLTRHEACLPYYLMRIRTIEILCLYRLSVQFEPSTAFPPSKFQVGLAGSCMTEWIHA